MLYTPGSVRSVRFRPILSSELVRRSRKLTVPTNPDRSRIVRPGPNGRGAERVGRVVEKNCIMWVDTRYTICYNKGEGVPDGAIRGITTKSCGKQGELQQNGCNRRIGAKINILCVFWSMTTTYCVSDERTLHIVAHDRAYHKI